GLAVQSGLAGGVASFLPPFPGLLEFAVPLGPDGLLPALQLGLGRDVADGAVQTHRVVLLHVARHDAPGVLHGQGRLRADAIPLDGPVPALDLAVALRVVRRRAHVRHATDPDELLEVPGDELRPVVRDDPRRDAREALAGPLHDLLDVHLGHRLADLPVDDVPAA